MADPLPSAPSDPPRRLTRAQMLDHAEAALRAALVDVDDALAWLLRIDATPRRPVLLDPQPARVAALHAVATNISKHLHTVLEGTGDGQQSG